MIVGLYLTYLAFVAISFGSFVSYLWGVSHSLGIMVGGFAVLAALTKFLGEVYVVQRRNQMTQQLFDQINAQKGGNTNLQDGTSVEEETKVGVN